ncbi:hypothetical protein [Neptunomonas sp. XY-337]|uniref:hypothetical protein n=1 Tax=Neptunomonas sp. XY-337 TaxID=2561897 RepID=UPI0010AB273D|nr:hypothetical protein [Neptunomonas sp. XY-337]
MSALRTLLIAALASQAGCFYMVTEGKGGVAERFPIAAYQQQLSERLQHCEATLDRHTHAGNAKRYPALYQQTQSQLIESRRLYQAEFYQQAEVTLESVETVLKLMHQEQQRSALSQLCQQQTHREICL